MTAIKRESAHVFILAYEASYGRLPTERAVASAINVSQGTAADVLRDIKDRRSKKGSEAPIKFNKAQERHIETSLAIRTQQLIITFEQRVRDGVASALAARDAADIEAVMQANALLERGARKPFTAAEYTGVLLRALHPDTSTPEARMEAFKLVNGKKFLLRDEGRIVLRGVRLPTTPEEWEAAKRATAEARKMKRQTA